MVKKEIQKFKFIKKEGGLERTLLTNVNYGRWAYEFTPEGSYHFEDATPMELPSGRLAYLDYNYIGGVDTAVVDTIQPQVNQMVTFNSTERVLESWDDSTSQLIKIPLDRLIS